MKEEIICESYVDFVNDALYPLHAVLVEYVFIMVVLNFFHLECCAGIYVYERGCINHQVKIEFSVIT